MVVGAPVGPLQPVAQRERVVAHVHVAVVAVVAVGAVVDDRGLGEPAAAVGHPAALVDGAQRLGVGHRALGLEVAVAVEAADAGVEVEELLGGDDAGVQRLEPVLHPHVVEGTPREAGLGVAPEHVDGVFEDVAARALRVGLGVVALLIGQHVGAELAGGDAAGVARHVGHGGEHEEAGHRPLFLLGERQPRGLLEVVVQQPRVGHERNRPRDDIGEAAPGDDAVEQPRIVVGDLVVLVRAARAAPADGEPRSAVGLDEPLLDHHHRLGREQVVAVVAEDVEAGRGHRVALAQHDVVGHAPGRRALAEPAVHAAAAERVDEAPVPPRRRLPRVGLGLTRGVVQHRDLVDRAVDGAGFDAHDVGRLSAVEGRRAGEVGRPHRGVGQRLEAAVFGRPVGVVDPPLDRAVFVERDAEGLARDELEAVGLADEGALVGTREDRPRDRVADDVDARRRAAGGADLDARRPRLEAAHEPLESAVVEPAEVAGHVAAAGQHRQRRVRCSRRGRHPHQDVAAAHHVGPVGQRRDLGGAPRRLGRRGGSGANRQQNEQGRDLPRPDLDERQGRDGHGRLLWCLGLCRPPIRSRAGKPAPNRIGRA